MRVITLFCLAVFFIAAPQRPASAQQQDDDAGPSLLVGTYNIVGEERDGQKVPEGHLKHVTVQIGTNAITTYDKDKKEVFAATYNLDTNKKPWRISMTATLTPTGEKGSKAKGLVEMDGDNVKLIYSLTDDAPTKFQTQPKQLMFTLRRSSK